MNYLFFDIESIDNKHETICSFGYILTDKNFSILEKDDILMNPNLISDEDYDYWAIKKIIKYDLEDIKSRPLFSAYYDKIKNLLTNQNNRILGFAIENEIKYINCECNRYGYPLIFNNELKYYDIQRFYKAFKKEKEVSSLKKLVQHYNIDVSKYSEHNGEDDSIMSMLIAKEICNELNISIEDFINQYETIISLDKSQKTIFKELLEKYPTREEKICICFSDSILKDNFETKLTLAKLVLDNNFNYTDRVADANIFVAGEKIGRRDKSFTYVSKEKTIKMITFEEFNNLLKK